MTHTPLEDLQLFHNLGDFFGQAVPSLRILLYSIFHLPTLHCFLKCSFYPSIFFSDILKDENLFYDLFIIPCLYQSFPYLKKKKTIFLLIVELFHLSISDFHSKLHRQGNWLLYLCSSTSGPVTVLESSKCAWSSKWVEKQCQEWKFCIDEEHLLWGPPHISSSECNRWARNQAE